MKPATEGQFHGVIASLLTTTDRKLLNFDAIQKLIALKPEDLASRFVKFINTNGNEKMMMKPDITLAELYYELTKDEGCRATITPDQVKLWKSFILELLDTHRAMTASWGKYDTLGDYFQKCYAKFDAADNDLAFAEAFTYFALSEKWK